MNRCERHLASITNLCDCGGRECNGSDRAIRFIRAWLREPDLSELPYVLVIASGFSAFRERCERLWAMPAVAVQRLDTLNFQSLYWLGREKPSTWTPSGDELDQWDLADPNYNPGDDPGEYCHRCGACIEDWQQICEDCDNAADEDPLYGGDGDEDEYPTYDGPDEDEP